MTVNHTVVTRICADCRQSYPYKEIHVCPVAAQAAALPARPEDELVGALLGDRYRIESFISRGGMGTVYLARHVVLDKSVAIKVLNDIKDEVAQKRFLLEAKAACAVNHEHIVNITDFGVLPDGRPYLVMEYLQGESLDALIARGALTPLRVCRIGEQIAHGLQAAHDKGILHRDLKPGNVYLLERHRRDYVKILDFGIAKVVNDGRPSNGADGLPNRPTQEGMVLGTAEYLAPEQALGEPLDHRADQFALGCILYEMLTGDVPFRGTSAMATVVKRLHDDPVPPRQFRPELNIPPSLEAIALKALSRHRDRRYASMAELGQALGREIDTLGGSLGEQSGSISAALIPSLIGVSGGVPAIAPTIPLVAASAVTMPSRIERPTLQNLRRPWLLPRRWRWTVSLGVATVVLGLSLGLYLGMSFWKTLRNPGPPPPVPVVKSQLVLEKEPRSEIEPRTTPEDEPDKPPTEIPDGKERVVSGSEVDGEKFYFLTFENANPVEVTISCTRQRPCTMAAQKLCQFRIGIEAGRCEASAPGHNAQTYTFRELRIRARGGRLRERVSLDAKGMGAIKL